MPTQGEALIVLEVTAARIVHSNKPVVGHCCSVLRCYMGAMHSIFAGWFAQASCLYHPGSAWSPTARL